MKRNFIQAMQVRVARSAIGASTLRGKPPGRVPAARNFLATLPLKPFGVSSDGLFYRRLDAATKRLQRVLPEGQWGTARKALNIFLRDAAYNHFLRHRFALDRSEVLLEIPLDSITAKKLREAEKHRNLPAWPGVSSLKPNTSKLYQDVARRVAKTREIARVHLDVYWWGGDRGDAAGR